MAKRSKIIAYVTKALGAPFVVNGHCIYVPFFRHFVRGFSVEGSGYKNEVYLREFLLPVFCWIDFVHVSYSPRLNYRDEPLRMTYEGSEREISDQMLARIEQLDLVELVMKPYGPSDFIRDYQFNLKALRWNVGAPTVFEVACCYALERDLDASLQWLRRFRDRIAGYYDQASPVVARHLREADALEQAIGDGPAKVGQHLRRVCRENAMLLGFMPAPLPTDDGCDDRTDQPTAAD